MKVKIKHYAYREGQYAGNTDCPRNRNPYTNAAGKPLRDYMNAYEQWNKGWDESRLVLEKKEGTNQ